MKETLSREDFIRAIRNINDSIQENKDYLSELDSFIGDGDHGSTIARGFRAAIKKIDEKEPESISGLLKQTGLTLISTMGGAAGPIFGSIFTEMAKVADGKEEIDLKAMYEMFSSALAKISKLGGAKPGDKTMIDSLDPTVSSLKDSVDNGLNIKEAFLNASTAAKEGAESTKEMVAKKGRSRYHGERALGHQDAGATTTSLIINAIYNSIE